jgi:hypothetical protein
VEMGEVPVVEPVMAAICRVQRNFG